MIVRKTVKYQVEFESGELHDLLNDLRSLPQANRVDGIRDFINKTGNAVL